MPKVYADHHVEAVREALLAIEGVQSVVASSGFQRVAVAFDPERVDRGALEKALSKAGYAPGEHWPLPDLPRPQEDDSPWFKTIQRVTSSNLADLEMSGDFRRY
jgi:copper chaperone CopZ